MDRDNHSGPGPEEWSTPFAEAGSPDLKPVMDLLEMVGLRRDEHLLVTPARSGRILSALASFHRGGVITAAEERQDLLEQCTRVLEEHDCERTGMELFATPPTGVVHPHRQDALICHCHMPSMVPDREFLQAVAANLRPGGRFAMQFPTTGFCRVLEETLKETLDRSVELPAWDDLVEPVEDRGLRELLRAMPFREAECHEKIYLQRFDTAMDAVDTLFIDGGWEGLQTVTDRKREELSQELRIRLTRKLGTIDGLEIPFRRLLAWGRL